MEQELGKNLADNGLGITLSEIARNYTPSTILNLWFRERNTYWTNMDASWFFMKDKKTLEKNLIVELLWTYSGNKSFVTPRKGYQGTFHSPRSQSLERSSAILFPEGKSWKKVKEAHKPVDFSPLNWEDSMSEVYQIMGILTNEEEISDLDERTPISIRILLDRQLHGRDNDIPSPKMEQRMGGYTDILKGNSKPKEIYWYY